LESFFIMRDQDLDYGSHFSLTIWYGGGDIYKCAPLFISK